MSDTPVDRPVLWIVAGGNIPLPDAGGATAYTFIQPHTLTLDKRENGSLGGMKRKDAYSLKAPVAAAYMLHMIGDTGNLPEFARVSGEGKRLVYFRPDRTSFGPLTLAKGEVAYIEVALRPAQSACTFGIAVITPKAPSAPSTPTTPVIADDHGNNMASATALAFGSWTQGKLEKIGDVDYFKVTVPSVGNYKVDISSTANFWPGVTVISANGVRQAAGHLNKNYGVNFTTAKSAIVHFEAAPTSISNPTGRYAIRVTKRL